MGAVRDSITRTLTEAFHPASLEVVDESHLHKGHAGWSESGESHFRVRIAASAFAGMSRVAMHRAINEALRTQLEGDVHALAIEARPA